MTRINILEFADYNSKAIYEFLFLQDETEFEIIIPRDPDAEETDNILVMVDFLNAAYAGQLLSEIASHFAYYVPCRHNKEPFNFQVLVSDMEKFADTLLLIIRGFNLRSDYYELFINFQDKSINFLDEAYDEHYECNTWGLLHVANQLL